MGRLTTGRLAAAVAAVGGLWVVLYVAVRDMPWRDAVELVALAGGVVLVGALVSAALLRRLRGASLGVQIAVVTGVPTVAALAGTALGAKLMFLSRHDLTVVAVLLLSGATVACVSALLLGDRVARSSAELQAATQRLGDGQPVAGPSATGATRELAQLHRELADASARLDEARARERALESSRRELIAWVSHDLRTPLAGIRAIAEALEDGIVTDAETIARYHATLRSESDRLAGLIDDLFELSRAQAAVIRLEMDRISLGDLVSDALAGVSPVAAAKGVRLEGRLDHEPPELVGSPPELLRALRNILENAVRHTPSDGTVVVEAGRAPEGEGLAFVSVLDSGGGIPVEALPRLFDVGFRVDPARGRDGGGGLGLAIARELVEAHRGEITVRNEAGGARFTVLLPVEPPTGVEPAAGGAGGGAARTLVVPEAARRPAGASSGPDRP